LNPIAAASMIAVRASHIISSSGPILSYQQLSRVSGS
jgi:hypothetical protein